MTQSNGSMAATPAGATHRSGLQFYKVAREGFYRWSPAYQRWRFMEDGAGRRAIRRATALKEDHACNR